MADKVAQIKSMEETLWDTANKFRYFVESAEYKHVELNLILLKNAKDRKLMAKRLLLAMKYSDMQFFLIHQIKSMKKITLIYHLYLLCS